MFRQLFRSPLTTRIVSLDSLEDDFSHMFAVHICKQVEQISIPFHAGISTICLETDSPISFEGSQSFHDHHRITLDCYIAPHPMTIMSILDVFSSPNIVWVVKYHNFDSDSTMARGLLDGPLSLIAGYGRSVDLSFFKWDLYLMNHLRKALRYRGSIDFEYYAEDEDIHHCATMTMLALKSCYVTRLGSDCDLIKLPIGGQSSFDPWRMIASLLL